MERRFRCTACGKCCVGWLPLTVNDALAHAGRFPLAVVWTPVRPASKAFDAAARLGLTVRTRDRKRLAVRIAPTAYIPPSMACPELTADNLCGIQDDKPSRCRSMPFLPYRAETDQADLLVPRPGWACDTSPEAPVVYRDKAILDRRDFDREHDDLVAQAAVLRAYGEALMASVPGMVDAWPRRRRDRRPAMWRSASPRCCAALATPTDPPSPGRSWRSWPASSTGWPATRRWPTTTAATVTGPGRWNASPEPPGKNHNSTDQDFSAVGLAAGGGLAAAPFFLAR